MSLGELLKGARVRKDLSQNNVARDLFVNQTMISKIEKGQRNMSDGMARTTTDILDDARYGFEVAREFSTGYITPLVTAGKAVELHRLALEEVFKREAKEAINKFNDVSLVKLPEYVDESEKEQIAQGIGELLDVQAVMNSFLMRLEQEYEISIKSCMKKRIPTWKAKGWIS